ncbi:MAG: DsbC/DsbD-like thiol-disulfide interchange protein [Paracoccaceae bacterium]|jgi:DsbC/DsbD-like thiol-disulfide interchange protein
MNKNRILLGGLAALFIQTQTLTAEFLGRTASEVVEITFLEGWRTADGRHMAGLQIELAPGWKTYWRAPGDGGVPTQIRLHNADGITGLQISWPTPEVFFTNGIRSIGYRDNVTLPVEISVSEDGDVMLDGQVDFGVCLDVCMPISLDLEGLLPATQTPDARIIAALSDGPLSAQEFGAGAVTCTIEPISDGLRVHAEIPIATAGPTETVVFELPDPSIWISEAQVERRGGTLFAVADIVPSDAGPFALSRSDLLITVLSARQSVELQGCHG